MPLKNMRYVSVHAQNRADMHRHAIFCRVMQSCTCLPADVAGRGMGSIQSTETFANGCERLGDLQIYVGASDALSPSPSYKH